jgi:hypothetical protein
MFVISQCYYSFTTVGLTMQRMLRIVDFRPSIAYIAHAMDYRSLIRCNAMQCDVYNGLVSKTRLTPTY